MPFKYMKDNISATLCMRDSNILPKDRTLASLCTRE